MNKLPINTTTRSGLTHLFLLLLTTLFSFAAAADAATTPQELLRGFTADPDSSVSSFQPLLSDPVGNYSLGFLRVNRTLLALAVIHVPSQEQLWIANSRFVQWSAPTRLIFNGSLVISDPHTGVFWSSYTDGDRVRLSNTSNLVIEDLGDSAGNPSVLWQSFENPYDTLMENQNFTSAMKLVSSNGLYSMKLGSDFIGFYAKFKADSDPGQIYLKHNPLEAKAHVIDGQGPVRIMLNPNGFLGMYQNGSVPVDVQPFSSFQQQGMGNRRVRLEPDGNLIGYYWTGSTWLVDFKQISDTCELPSPCGPYGLCEPGKGCYCLDKRTEYSSGKCNPPGSQNSGGDFCGMVSKKHRVMRRSGVELPYKEIMGYTKMSSLEECESTCEENCTCWGAVYSNSSGFCYTIDYPIQTLVGVEDEGKVGYFKVREGAGKGKVEVGLGVGLGLCGAVLLFLGVVGVVLYRRKRMGSGLVEEETGGGAVGPYKDLGSASFKSIELSER